MFKLLKSNSKSTFLFIHSEYFDGNNNIKPVGSKIQLPTLAKTFQRIADDPLSFYNGSLAEDIVADIQDEGQYFHKN